MQDLFFYCDECLYSPVTDSHILTKVRLCCSKMVLVYYGYF